MPGRSRRLRGLGKGERSFCSWDEDSITMSVDAVRGCRARLDVRADRLADLRLDHAALLRPAECEPRRGSVRAPRATCRPRCSGSLRAGTSALIRALESSAEADAMVVAADARHAKPGSAAGDAVRRGQRRRIGRPATTLIARYLGSASTATSSSTTSAAEGQKYDYQWEERWIRDEGYLKIVPDGRRRLLEQTGTRRPGSTTSASRRPCPGSRRQSQSASGCKPESVVDESRGALRRHGRGAPAACCSRAALETAKPGQTHPARGFGAGCDALLFEATEADRCLPVGVTRQRCSRTRRHRQELQQAAVVLPASSISTGACAPRRTQRRR